MRWWFPLAVSVVVAGLAGGCSTAVSAVTTGPAAPATPPSSSAQPAVTEPDTSGALTGPPPNEQQVRIAAIASSHRGGDPLTQPLPGGAKANVAGYLASGGAEFVAFVDQVARVDLAGGTLACANLAGTATADALDRMYNFVAGAPEESLGSPGASLMIDTQRLVAACQASDTAAMDELVGRIALEWTVVERWLRATGATP